MIEISEILFGVSEKVFENECTLRVHWLEMKSFKFTLPIDDTKYFYGWCLRFTIQTTILENYGVTNYDEIFLVSNVISFHRPYFVHKKSQQNISIQFKWIVNSFIYLTSVISRFMMGVL